RKWLYKADISPVRRTHRGLRSALRPLWAIPVEQSGDRHDPHSCAPAAKIGPPSDQDLARTREGRAEPRRSRRRGWARPSVRRGSPGEVEGQTRRRNTTLEE